jgi:hypothetical protein
MGIKNGLSSYWAVQAPKTTKAALEISAAHHHVE